MKKSLILLGFLFLCPGVLATEPTPTETNSLIVAYQLLDDSWIQEVGALTNDFARIYKDSLSTNQPPSYGAWVADGNNLTFTSFSQRDLWDYMYNNSNSSNQNLFRSYVQTDDIGDYITVSRLMTASQGGSMTNNFNGSWSLNIKDLALQNNARRLVSLSTVQTEQEIAAISNAACNCDWQIVTNIFNCVYAISNTLDKVEYNTYHSMTNTEGILSAIYSNWQGQNISLADWTRYIWVYLTTNNSGKPLKDLLVDLNNSIVSNRIDIASLSNHTWKVTFPVSPESAYYDNSFGSLLEYFYSSQDGRESFISDSSPWDFFGNIYGMTNTVNSLLNSLVSNAVVDYWNFFTIYNDIFPVVSNSWNIVTNKTEGVVYGVILPELSNVQNEPNIYSALTNAYLTSYNQQSDLTWLDRVELLLAALVFPDTSATNTVENADTAQSASEQTAQQFSDQLGQVTSALVSGNPSQDFQTTTGHLTTLLSTLRQHMVIQKPQAILIPSIDAPLEAIGGQPTDGPVIDTQNSALGDFADFLRNLFSLCWVFGFFIMAYKSILLIFRIYASVYNFSQALFRRILS